MDHNSLLLQEAAQLLNVGSPRNLASSPSPMSNNTGNGGGGIFTNDHLATMHGVPSPSKMSTVSSLSAGAASDHSGHVSPLRKNRAVNALALTMLHDVAATRELIDLTDAMHSAEFRRLQEAHRLLQEEKKIRTAYMESLQAQAEELSVQKRKLLAPFLADVAAPTSPTMMNEDTASARSGGGPSFLNHSHLQQQQQQHHAAASVSGRDSNAAPSQRGGSSMAYPQGSAAGAGGFASNTIPGSGASAYSASRAPPGHLLQQQQRTSSPPGAHHHHHPPSAQSALAQQRKLVANIPGVSFGALTTASCASRYATHWAKEADESE